MFLSTLANATVGKEIVCYDEGSYNYRLVDFTQPIDNKTWTGLIDNGLLVRSKTIHTKIPTADVYDCAHNDEMGRAIIGGEYGLGKITKEVNHPRDLSLDFETTFNCFCKLNKTLLNNCSVHICDSVDRYRGDVTMIMCKNGVTKYETHLDPTAFGD